MAIVLPQGLLNNTDTEYIRRFVIDEARILAVVGLHGNTFKPHTGTKTSVLFLQKYTDEQRGRIQEIKAEHEGELELKEIDYPIFFAVNQKPVKDNSGEYRYKKGANGKPLLDEHGYPVIDHDLDDIAEAFVKFAKEQGFDFWRS